MHEFLKKELKLDRRAGTYLFYGEDREALLKEALDFAKALNCKNSVDGFCGHCEICKRIDHLTYGDLFLLEDLSGIKIDEIRNIIGSAVTSSYEGGKKIFILRDIERMRKEGSNALLKVIEEPPKDTFFFLMTNTLNILPTIKSRSVLITVPKKTAEELGVTQEEYDFFLGNSKEIEKYKLSGETIEGRCSYREIGKYLQAEDKTSVYKSLRDFVNSKDYLDELDKISFAEEILRSNKEKNKELYREIITYVLYLLKKDEKLEDYLAFKGFLRYPVNDKGILQSFFLKI